MTLLVSFFSFFFPFFLTPSTSVFTDGRVGAVDEATGEGGRVILVLLPLLLLIFLSCPVVIAVKEGEVVATVGAIGVFFFFYFLL